MKKINILLLLVVLFISTNMVMAADPGDSTATCAISVTVGQIIEWSANFAAISLTTISNQADAPEDNKTQTLYVNCNITIAADNTTTSQLSSATDALVTKYKLADDGDGVATTGATAADETTSGVATWTDYNLFLNTVLPMTHVDTDGAVDITLYVQATNNAGEVADAGAYTATQTLTAAWTSD